MNESIKNSPISRRFRGLLPVVVDVETSGLKPATDALLEVAAIAITMNAEGKLCQGAKYSTNVEPFPGARIDPDALQVTGIDPTHPFRGALPEAQALHRLFAMVRRALEESGCYRAVLVGHNAWFDLSFILAAAKRSGMTHLPFHTFTTFDTASLSAMVFGETVLARAARRARVPFNIAEAHSAIYDVDRTAELFCVIANRF